MRTTAAALFVFAFTLPLSAQSVIVGSQSVNASHATAFPPPYTLVDLSHPATADGSVAFASARWLPPGCVNAKRTTAVSGLRGGNLGQEPHQDQFLFLGSARAL